MRPLHQRCLEAERLQIARACLLIRRWSQPQYILSLRVDEVFCRVAKAAQERFKAEVEAVRYCDLAAILPRGPFGARKPMYQKANTSKAPYTA